MIFFDIFTRNNINVAHFEVFRSRTLAMIPYNKRMDMAPWSRELKLMRYIEVFNIYILLDSS